MSSVLSTKPCCSSRSCRRRSSGVALPSTPASDCCSAPAAPPSSRTASSNLQGFAQGAAGGKRKGAVRGSGGACRALPRRTGTADTQWLQLHGLHSRHTTGLQDRGERRYCGLGACAPSRQDQACRRGSPLAALRHGGAAHRAVISVVGAPWAANRAPRPQQRRPTCVLAKAAPQAWLSRLHSSSSSSLYWEVNARRLPASGASMFPRN